MVPAVVRIDVTYRIKAAYAVQGPSEYGAPVDQGVELGPDGWPLIPASSWRGRVRAHLEALLRGMGVPVCRPPRPEATCPHGGVVLAALQVKGRTFCPVCEVFGSPWLPSRIQFSDLRHPGPRDSFQPPPIAIRVNVAINRLLGSAEEQRLVAYQTAGSGAVDDENLGLLFGTVRGSLEPSQVGLVVAALRLPKHLGSRKGSGLGLVEDPQFAVFLQERPQGPVTPVEQSVLDAWIENGLQEVEHLAPPSTV